MATDLALTAPSDLEDAFRIRLRKPAMGSHFEIILDGDRPERELWAMAEEAYELVREIEGQLSTFIPASEVSHINRSAHERPVTVTPTVLDVLLIARDVHAETGGAFDATLLPLVECWGFHRREGRIPPEDELAEARGRVGMDKVEIDAAARTIRFAREGMGIAFGGIGKGYAIDKVIERLRAWGVRCALAQMGGSTVYAMGAPPIADAWNLGVRPPGASAERWGSIGIVDGAISASGDFERFFEVDGRRYGHILDPRTGCPVTERRSAVAMCPTAARADALSTAFVVMGLERTRQYCAAHEASAVMGILDDAGSVAVHEIGCRIRGAAPTTDT